MLVLEKQEEVADNGGEAGTKGEVLGRVDFLEARLESSSTA